MARAWIVSFVVVAAVTGVVLWATRGGGGSNGPTPVRGGPEAPAKQVLDVESIEAYLRVTPQIDEILARSHLDGTLTTPEGGAANRAKIDGLKAKYGYSPESWDRLRLRVENAVIALRAEKNTPERHAQIDREIAMKEAALEGSSDSVREQLQKDIAALRKLKEAKIDLHENDRALLKRYWTDLDRVVPRVR